MSYQDLYGWTMDQIVAQVGTRNNCTFCGVFRRQALDRGAQLIGANKVRLLRWYGCHCLTSREVWQNPLPRIPNQVAALASLAGRCGILSSTPPPSGGDGP